MREGIDVALGQAVNVPLTLRLSAVSEKIVVTSENPVVETTRVEGSTRIDKDAVKSLPNNGRNFLDFAKLTPSVAGVRSYRTGPDWSPDGTKIAYEQQNGDFQVWMINVADKKMRKLTSIGENEDPSWAPDSRHIVLSTTRNRTKYLWVLDTKSGRMRQLTHLDGARLAAWSPFLGGDTFLATAATVASVPVSGDR